MDNTMTLEESFEKLETIVNALESKDISLEDAFAKYKEGLGIVKQCNDMIDKVEKEVSMVNDAGDLSKLE